MQPYAATVCRNPNIAGDCALIITKTATGDYEAFVGTSEEIDLQLAGELPIEGEIVRAYTGLRGRFASDIARDFEYHSSNHLARCKFLHDQASALEDLESMIREDRMIDTSSDNPNYRAVLMRGDYPGARQ